MNKLKKMFVLTGLSVSACVFLYNLITTLYKPALVYLSGAVLCFFAVSFIFGFLNKGTSEGKAAEEIKSIAIAGACVTGVVATAAIKNAVPDMFVFNLCIFVLIVAAVLLIAFIKKMGRVNFIEEIKNSITQVALFESKALLPNVRV